MAFVEIAEVEGVLINAAVEGAFLSVEGAVVVGKVLPAISTAQMFDPVSRQW